MTTAAELDLRAIEQFVYRETRLADEHDYDAWEALWTDDARYWVPAGATGDPQAQMSIIFDNRSRIATRLKQLRTGKRYAQSPPSNLRHLVTNIEVLGVDRGDTEQPGVDRGDTEQPGVDRSDTEQPGVDRSDTVVGGNFIVAESKPRGTRIWAGRVTYRLRLVDGEIRMAYKKVDLIDAGHPVPTLGFLI